MTSLERMTLGLLLEATAATNPQSGGAVAPQDWRPRITRHAVTVEKVAPTCRQLLARHLSQHDLNLHSYRAKDGIPRPTPLSARELMSEG